MLAFVATIALINLMLGMSVAIIVSNETADIKRMLAKLPIPYFKCRFAAEIEHSHGDEHSTTEHAHDASHGEIKSAPPTGLDIPQAWQDLLKAEHLHPHTLFEAALLCLRLQLNSYQPTLTKFESALRELSTNSVKDVLAKQLEDIKKLVEPWKQWTSETTTWLSEHQDKLGTDSTTATDFEEKLLDRVTHAKNLLRLTASCAEEGKTDAVLRALQLEINRDLEGTHGLNDFTLDAIASSFASDDRLHSLPEAWQKDKATGLHNRCGLESLVKEWREKDPQQKRLLSGLFVECDRMGKINERFGTARGDQIFEAFAKVVYEATRYERDDRVARLSGSTIAVLLADSGAAGARCAAERIRQMIEATTFQVGTEEITLIANCAVTDFMLDDHLSDVLPRLHEGIKEAKKAGRNRTSIDEGDGPKVFEALPMTVKGRVIQVGSENSVGDKSTASTGN